MSPVKRLTVLVAMLLVGGLLVGCGSASGTGNPVPSAWIGQTYQRMGNAYTATGTPESVASAIAGHTAPRARSSNGDRRFLRYRDHIVAVQPRGAGGSRIEIETYARGHQRWGTYIGGVWPAPGRAGDGYRGGGPGSGK
ncbi:DUF4247 domain-containing protein [Streptomyces sp. ST2-7A]|uniref:DUF4247 domain-containing protein n=1 Tax=Streptomyces sp. ST2-7A TaxID=2907214 RepID=UPI001F1BB6D0|nr:DUF4247 domain-containing protein [Streptomyces sp. ST2-7A]MCE7081039.1 DUF4247 domain-containing protein [Streptomyces sp. ST2-7A]